MSFGYAECKIN